MTSQEARKILALFRPGTADENDPFFDEARQLARTDPELAKLLRDHGEARQIVRQKLQAIPIPPGLKEQILSERKIHRPNFRSTWLPWLAAAAVVALLAGIGSGFWPLPGLTDRFASYRKRMTETALRNYSMDLTTGDTAKIRQFLRSRNAPADYALPPGLASASAVGCVATRWQNRPVSMICFKSGRPLPRGEQSDLWLFVIDAKNLPRSPSSEEPVFARVNKATTASWSDGKKNYLLATIGDEASLRRYVHQP